MRYCKKTICFKDDGSLTFAIFVCGNEVNGASGKCTIRSVKTCLNDHRNEKCGKNCYHDSGIKKCAEEMSCGRVKFFKHCMKRMSNFRK